jgi:hypothetical protein
VNLLVLKFGIHITNLKISLWYNFRGKIPIFEPSGGFQSGQT